MKLLKKMAVIATFFGVLFALTSVANADFLPYKESGTFLKVSEKTVPVNIKYPKSSKKQINAIFCNGRLCIPLKSAVADLGGNLETKGNNFKITIGEKYIFIPIEPSVSNKCVMVYKDSVGYISLYSLLEPFDFVPSFDVNTNTVYIYKKQYVEDTRPAVTSQNFKEAYIRFEDIMADGLDKEPDYPTDKLEKLMYMSEYMYRRGQQFYIAWIPLYVNPQTNYKNNVSLDYNLYNSCFIYTLDYMIGHGGKIVLHGYSHQYGNEKSSVGYEWGKGTPYSYTEQQQRMINAKTIAWRLGYETDIFEFPHYGATIPQLRMAEHYFKIIYQEYPNQGTVITTKLNDKGNKVYYIPTTAEYVKNLYKSAETIEKIKKLASNGQVVSLFYHPKIDITSQDAVSIKSDDDNGIKYWSFSEYSVLSAIIDTVNANGYSFRHTSFW